MATPAAQRWTALIAELDDSDLSIRKFAHARGINPRTLTWWKWRLRKEEEERQDDGFFELVPREHLAALDLTVGGASITVDRDTDLCLLRRVVEALA
jgi:hypothetical protein